MAYTVELTTSAEKALRKVDKPIRRRVLTALDQLALQRRPPGCKKLSGGSEWWRIRAARHWRIIYEIRDTELLVLVIDIDHLSRLQRQKLSNSHIGHR